MNKTKFCTILLGAIFMLSACTQALINTTRYGIFTTQESNLRQENYAAADYMNQHAAPFIERTDLIEALPLHERQEPAITSDLGAMIAEHIGTRFSQLGYRVNLASVMSATAKDYYAPAIEEGEAADFILSGNYMREKQLLNISARITDARTNQVIAVFDYTLPLNYEIEDLSRAKTRIFKR